MQGDPNISNSGSSLPRSQGASQVLRSKNLKRDEAIRNKVALELDKRTKKKTFNTSPQKKSKSTVSSLRPATAIIIMESAKIIQAAQLMAAKRTDAVLAVNKEGELTGILTDKDVAFRVVAENLDVKTTIVKDVMTCDPIAVFDKGSRNEALSIMISRKFRHLPVISEVISETNEVKTSVVGLLDITKCVFERLDDLEKKVMEDQNIITAMQVLEKRGTVDSDRVDSLMIQHECPDIKQVLGKSDFGGDFPNISVKASAYEAACVMKKYHSTAVLVMGTPDGKDKVGGIFTTKDIVLRVIAASLDPATTSTPHPDFVCSNSSILFALKKLHAGHFLHLPVIDDTVPVGLVDVMTLTVAMLTYLMSKTSGAALDPTDQGPMWNSFWNSTFSGNVETDVTSVKSEKQSSIHFKERKEQLQYPAREPSQSSYREPSVPFRPVYEEMFSFKLKDMTDAKEKIYRFTIPGNSLDVLYENIIQKTGYEFQGLDIQTKTGPQRVCYLDDEGDVVALESDLDLQEAVRASMSLSLSARRVLIYLGEPPINAIQAKIESRSNSFRSPSPIQSGKMEIGVGGFFKDSPLAVNVGVSCGIVVVAFYLMVKISKM